MDKLFAIFIIVLSIAITVSVSLPVRTEPTDTLNKHNISSKYIIDLTQLKESLYGKPSRLSGERLSSWKPEHGTNPEEMGSYFEGDLLIPRPIMRNGILEQSLRWTDGIIPYSIDGDFNERELLLIQSAIEVYHSKTCIKLIERTNEEDYVSIINGLTGCWSSVGNIGGKQEINLQSPMCLHKIGTILHEIMHTCGFMHEQNRYERDSYIKVIWENIEHEMADSFEKTSALTTDGYGEPYDLGSVMHYSEKAFSKNGEPTFTLWHGSYDGHIGQRKGFSTSDIIKINNMYNCGHINN